MALTELEANVENITPLGDEPNDAPDGLSANELKALYDKAGKDIKRYINETLTKELDRIISDLEGSLSAAASAIVTLQNTMATDDELGAVQGALEDAIGLVRDEVGSHEGDTNNPHEVTAEQVGLGNVDNTSDADKPISTDTQEALDGKMPKLSSPVVGAGNFAEIKDDGTVGDSGYASSSFADSSEVQGVQDSLDDHKGNTNNPHGVTAAQVGLGNVNNTSDANKPISTATQTALNGKADKVSGATDGDFAALDEFGNLTDSGVSADDFMLTSPQTLTEAQQTQARHNIKAAKWATATATNKPEAGATLPATALSVDDAEEGQPISLTFAADNASGVANDGKYELYGYLRIYHQLAKAPSSWTRTSSSGSTVTINDNVITVQVSANYQGARTTGMTSLSSAQSGHYFLYSCEAKAEDENSVGKSVYPTVSQNAGVSYSGFALTNDWVSHSQIKAAGTISPDQFVFTALSGTHFQLRNVMLFDLTKMFPVDRPTTVSAFWAKMAAAGYGTGYQAPTADTNLVQSTFDFSTDPIAAGETADVTAETSLQTGYNQIVQTSGGTTDNTVTLTYPRDIGIVLNNLAAAIAALPSSGN